MHETLPDHELSKTIATGMAQYLREFCNRVTSLATNLSDEQFWTKPYPYGNSFGNLVLHLTGNLNYYIGTQIENTGYVRERELEFTQILPGHKEQVLQNLEAAVAMVVASLHSQSPQDWSRTYSAVGVDDADRFGIYLRCTAHLHHHIGQMIYLVKEFSRHEERQ